MECRICGGEAEEQAFPFETEWNGTTFRYRACDRCGTTNVDPAPSDDDLRTIYAWDNYHAVHFVDGAAAQRDRDALAFFARHRAPTGTLLDFGCGDGGFLVAARQAGFTVRGVEYERSTILQASARADAPVSTLDEVIAAGHRFDVIHMNDVLPHLVDPASTLRTVDRLLAPDGVLFIEGPLENNASLVYWVASGAKRWRRRLGFDRVARQPPTMLMRLTRDGQREFFRNRLGYRELAFDTYETGWPYYVPDREWSSSGEIVKQSVGWAAIALARLRLDALPLLGNRFYGLFTPPRAR